MLVKVTCLGALILPKAVTGKLRLPGTSETEVPIPVRFSTCGLEPSLSVTVTLPYLVPVVLGVKVTEIVHCAPPDRLPGQVLVCV